MEAINVHVLLYPDRKNYSMRYNCPYTGKQIARSTGTTSKREALKRAAVWEADLRQGRYQRASQVSWEDFREKYETEVVPGLASRTGDKIASTLNAIERILRPRKVRDLTSDRLSYFVSQLRSEVIQRKTAKRSESTIAGHLSHLKAALGCAVEWGYLPSRPKIPKLKRVKRSKVMKGRAITTEEFERMLAVVPKATSAYDRKACKHTLADHRVAQSWAHLLYGLWWSGLRLDEALRLYWNDDECPADGLSVEMYSKRPMLVIPAEGEKGHQDRLLPLAPEFAEYLQQIPEEERQGRIFRPLAPCTQGEVTRVDVASKRIVKIGKLAGVVVDSKSGKCASAHDLRRAFGERWALRVMPVVLKDLMRHDSLDTTLKYYVGRDAETTADVLYKAVEQSQVTFQVTSGDLIPAPS